MMKKIILRANAKLNLSLDVIGRLENGYHELRMIMQSVDLCDIVTLTENDERSIRLSVSGMDVTTGKENLAYRAAELFCREYNVMQGVDIHIQKKIPIGSGMAGGSADAAAVLVGCNHLFERNIPMDELMRLGLYLGADVPFAILGGLALAEGIGERLSKLPFVPMDFLIVKPFRSMSTKEVFQKLDVQSICQRPDQEYLMDCIRRKKVSDLAIHMRNVLESVTIKEMPELQEIKRDLIDCGALGAMMTGSGSAVFGVFNDLKKMKCAYGELCTREGIQVYLASAAEKGVEVE